MGKIRLVVAFRRAYRGDTVHAAFRNVLAHARTRLIQMKISRRVGGWRHTLPDMVDSLGLSAALFDFSKRRRVHISPALAALLERDPEHDRLEVEIRASATAPSGSPRERGGEAARRVRTRRAEYRLRVWEAGAATGEDGVVVVLVEHGSPELPGDGVLAERFGLTRAESRVARLLAEGKSNAEVAAALSISPHTAERHTEKVLQKLEIHSRAAVGHRIGREPAAAPHPSRPPAPRRP
jgi:DNA-binding CsgD family transcriptional regulator